MLTDGILHIQDLTQSSFAPYGWLLGKSMPSEDSGIPRFSNPATDFWQEHVFDTGPGGETEVLWVNYRSAVAPLPLQSLEMHRLTEQAIVPLNGDIIQVVATSSADGSPDLTTLAAFRIPAGKGICMAPGCWHATRACAPEVTCLMLTRRSTTRDLIDMLAAGSNIEDGQARESAIANIPTVKLGSADERDALDDAEDRWLK